MMHGSSQPPILDIFFPGYSQAPTLALLPLPSLSPGGSAPDLPSQPDAASKLPHGQRLCPTSNTQHRLPGEALSTPTPRFKASASSRLRSTALQGWGEQLGYSSITTSNLASQLPAPLQLPTPPTPQPAAPFKPFQTGQPDFGGTGGPQPPRWQWGQPPSHVPPRPPCRSTHGTGQAADSCFSSSPPRFPGRACEQC